jgi:hypothetical protein
VNYYGYSRSTADMEIWISFDAANAALVAEALRQFGFEQANAEPLSRPNQIIRMGVQPLRLERCGVRRLLRAPRDTGSRRMPRAGDPPDDLKRNKRVSGRAKDLADLEELE